MTGSSRKFVSASSQSQLIAGHDLRPCLHDPAGVGMAAYIELADAYPPAELLANADTTIEYCITRSNTLKAQRAALTADLANANQVIEQLQSAAMMRTEEENELKHQLGIVSLPCRHSRPPLTRSSRRALNPRLTPLTQRLRRLRRPRAPVTATSREQRTLLLAVATPL